MNLLITAIHVSCFSDKGFMVGIIFFTLDYIRNTYLNCKPLPSTLNANRKPLPQALTLNPNPKCLPKTLM